MPVADYSLIVILREKEVPVKIALRLLLAVVAYFAIRAVGTWYADYAVNDVERRIEKAISQIELPYVVSDVQKITDLRVFGNILDREFVVKAPITDAYLSELSTMLCQAFSKKLAGATIRDTYRNEAGETIAEFSQKIDDCP